MNRQFMSRRVFMGTAGAAAIGIAGASMGHSERQPGEAALALNEHPKAKAASESKIYSLDGRWKLSFFPQEKYEIRDPDGLSRLRLTSIDAIVPGETALDLARHGELPADLLFGANILKVEAYERYEWWYQREFATPEAAAGSRTELRFRGVDCLATYWLNGAKLGETSNALIEHHFDVSRNLRQSKPNVLTIRLRSPIVEAARKTYDIADTAAIHNADRLWIRKPAHSFGWDIMPRAVTAGIWRPVELVVRGPCEIAEMHFDTRSLNSGKVTLAVSYRIAADPTLPEHAQLHVEGHCGDATFSSVEELQFTAGSFLIDIADPKLWWPRGYGNPNLYEVTTQLRSNKEAIASRKDVIGIRTVELVRHDADGLAGTREFLFKVNGEPILCKGSNWTPLDVFHSRDAARYDQVLDLAIDIGCNILRCWGGNVYEDDAFFDKCDRSGIMVWQDFAMACALYPQTEDFLNTIREEAVSIIAKLRNHPSLLLWCGDNECDMFYHMAGLNPNNNQITRKVLPEAIARCDPYRNYLPSSPYMSPEVIAAGSSQSNPEIHSAYINTGEIAADNDAIMPEIHLWGPRDYYKSQFYTQHTAPFISEAGYYGCPGASSLKRFLDSQHLWPWKNNPWWALHSTSSTMDPRQNYLLANETRELFGIIPEDRNDFILLSQITQAEALKYFVEKTRMNKWKTTGMIWWNLMAGWPAIGVTVVDYFFNKKLAYYYIRRVQQPLCIMMDEPRNWHCRVVVGNDSRSDANGRFRVVDADSGQELLAGRYSSRANTNLEVGEIPVFHSDKRLFLIEWTAFGKKYANHYVQGMPPLSIKHYKDWLPKIAALQGDFDANMIGS